jgi:hypothetical protein
MDPNSVEGYFVSLVDLEKIEMCGYYQEWPNGSPPQFQSRRYLRDNCRALVLCLDCQKKLEPPTKEQDDP